MVWCSVWNDRILAVWQKETQWQRYAWRPLESRGRDTMTRSPSPETIKLLLIPISICLSSFPLYTTGPLVSLRPLFASLAVLISCFQRVCSSLCIIFFGLPLHPFWVCSVRVYVTYVFYLCLRVYAVQSCDGGCTGSSKGNKVTLCFPAVLQIYLPVSLSLSLTTRDQPLSVHVLATNNEPHCSIKVLVVWLKKY